MNKSVALTGLLFAGWLQAEEPRWTASVPLWKVLGQQGDLVAVHPGPTWLDSTGPITPAARISRIEPVADTPKSEASLPMPRLVPNPLPAALRTLDEEPAVPPTPAPPTKLLGPSLGPVTGPDLGLLPIEASDSEEPVGDLFASDRVEPLPARTAGPIIAAAVEPWSAFALPRRILPTTIRMKHVFASPYFPVHHPEARALIPTELPAPAKLAPPPLDE